MQPLSSFRSPTLAHDTPGVISVGQSFSILSSWVGLCPFFPYRGYWVLHHQPGRRVVYPIALDSQAARPTTSLAMSLQP